MICGLVQKVFESTLSMLGSFVHLLMYGNLSSKYSSRNIFFCLMSCFCRCLIGPL